MSDRIIIFLATVGLLVVLIAAFPFYVYNRDFRRCGALENGLHLGYNAVFDLWRPIFRPIVVPKLPNGRPLADAEYWDIYISDTTLYGLVLGDDRDEPNYALAWRADTGLVLEHQDQALYEKLVAEAGDTNVGIGPGQFGPGSVMRRMKEQLGYTDQWCATRFVTW